jgi:hypothetical protein
MVSAVATMTSLRLPAVVATWGLWLGQINTANAVVGHDCSGVTESIVLKVLIAAS